MPIISKEKGLQVKDVMTKNPICCTPETNLREVAQLMMERDCGEIPVVDSLSSRPVTGLANSPNRLIGFLFLRDPGSDFLRFTGFPQNSRERR